MLIREYHNTGDRHELVWECSRVVADFTDSTRALMARNELRRRLDGRGVHVDHVAPGGSAAMPVSNHVRVIDLPPDQVVSPPRATNPPSQARPTREPEPDARTGTNPRTSSRDRSEPRPHLSKTSAWRTAALVAALAFSGFAAYRGAEQAAFSLRLNRLRKEKTPAQNLSDKDLYSSIQREVSVEVRPYLSRNAAEALETARDIQASQERIRLASPDELPDLVKHLGVLHLRLSRELTGTAAGAEAVGKRLAHCRDLALDRAGVVALREIHLKQESTRQPDALVSADLYNQSRLAGRQQEAFMQTTSALDRIGLRVIQPRAGERPSDHRDGSPVRDLRGLLVELAGFHLMRSRTCQRLQGQVNQPSPEQIRTLLLAPPPESILDQIQETAAEIQEDIETLERNDLPTPLGDLKDIPAEFYPAPPTSRVQTTK